MASVVYYTNKKTGLVTAYRSEARWDPEKGYSVPKRTYLGIVDPVTKEIIPSSGKRGRKKKERTPDPAPSPSEYEEAALELEQLRMSLRNLQEQVQTMQKEHTETAQMLQKLQQQFNTVISGLMQQFPEDS